MTFTIITSAESKVVCWGEGGGRVKSNSVCFRMGGFVVLGYQMLDRVDIGNCVSVLQGNSGEFHSFSVEAQDLGEIQDEGDVACPLIITDHLMICVHASCSSVTL